jgi:hypothetical protein
LLVMDLSVLQTVCTILSDRSSSGAFQAIVAESPEGRLWCLHTGGSISVRTRDANGGSYAIVGSAETQCLICFSVSSATLRESNLTL